MGGGQVALELERRTSECLSQTRVPGYLSYRDPTRFSGTLSFLEVLPHCDWKMIFKL